MAECDAQTIVLVILCFIFPPLAVGLKVGGCTGHVWLNILLCFLAWVPGVLHGLWVVFKD